MDYAVSFGRIGKSAPAPPGPAFRLAVLGDFSGRANAGIVETGAALTRRKPLKADVDNLDDLVARLAPKITIALDDAGAVSVPIAGMDDFHPDQLAENLPIFEALLALRRNLQSPNGFDRAAKELLSWAGKTAPRVARAPARGSAVATDRKLSDFARLSGRAAPAPERSADDLIGRLVGPFIASCRDARQEAMVAQVDEALSAAMRRVLHHPDFQAAEGLWRGVEFLVRRIETGARLQIVLYDISAEELAADLAAADALETSALYALLVEQPALDAQQGPLSLIAGLYGFEATPPHADLLGRVAQVAAAAGAPFVAGIGSDALGAPMHEWHPLVQQAWNALRALPAAAYLGLATPRFLLRMPYGKKTEPIDAFAFEEFTRKGGLSGMLWGHPALLVALLTAQTWLADSKAMKLGRVANVGDLPVYVYHDTDGEQIALPCTERLFSERQAVQVSGCGVMPVVSLRGRPEVRLASFDALAGKPLAGRWAPVEIAPPPVPAAKPPPVAEPAQAVSAPATSEPKPPSPATSRDDDLDALLASLNAEPAPPAASDTEADLDALLASLK